MNRRRMVCLAATGLTAALLGAGVLNPSLAFAAQCGSGKAAVWSGEGYTGTKFEWTPTQSYILFGFEAQSGANCSDNEVGGFDANNGLKWTLVASANNINLPDGSIKGAVPVSGNHNEVVLVD